MKLKIQDYISCFKLSDLFLKYVIIIVCISINAAATGFVLQL